MKAKHVKYEMVSAIARKYAAARGHETGAKVGPDVLIAALAKAIGADAAAPILAEAGVREAALFVETVPAAEVEEAQALPALVPDEHLVSLLKGDLKPFREGEMGAMEALRILLSPGRIPQEVLKTLGGGDASIIRIEDRVLFDTRLFTRNLARVYQSRFALGAKYQYGGKDEVYADFVTGEHDDTFTKAYRDLLRKESHNWEKYFNSPVYDRSPLGEIRASYGEIEAHIMGAVLLAEMGYVGGDTLRVRELGYILDPKYFHCVLGKVRRGVKALHVNRRVEILPHFDGEVQLGCQVLPSEDMLDAWLDYLDHNAVILDDEVEDMIQTISDLENTPDQL